MYLQLFFAGKQIESKKKKKKKEEKNINITISNVQIYVIWMR